MGYCEWGLQLPDGPECRQQTGNKVWSPAPAPDHIPVGLEKMLRLGENGMES